MIIKNLNAKLQSLFISGLLLTMVFGCLLFAAPNASAWGVSVTYSPGESYIGDSVDFHCTIRNTGSYAIDLTSARLIIDWGSIDTNKALAGSYSIASGGSSTLSASFTVPSVIAGTYIMKVELKGKASSDLFSETHTYNCELDVSELPVLQLSIQADVTSGTAPFDTQFISTGSGVPPYSYYWTFGDGGHSTASDPSHRYTEPGTYTVTLVVTDGKGRTVSDSMSISVEAASITDDEFWEGGGIVDSKALLILGVIVIAIVLVIILLFFAFRKKDDPKSVASLPQTQSELVQSTCSGCGKELPAGGGFCPNCGKKIN